MCPKSSRLTDERCARRGAVVLFLLVSLTIFLGVFAVAVNRFWLWSVHEEIKSAADAAALAACASLADDDLLRGDPSLYPALMERAADAANALAQSNLVRGHPLELQDNSRNAANGDVLIGTVTMPLAHDFVPISGRESPAADQSRINTVRIIGRQTKSRNNAPIMIFGPLFGVSSANVAATSTATVDHGVRGMDTRYGPIPLAPLALRSDPVLPLSWDNQVEAGAGPDTMKFDRATGTFTGGPDLIHEFQAAYPTSQDQLASGNVALLFLPSATPTNIATQLANGMTAADLANDGGRFVLPDAGTKNVVGQQVGPAGSDSTIQDIAGSLHQLKLSGAVRVWPLYRGFNIGSNTVQVSSFVAARVVNVVPPTDGQPLSFTLQATVLVVPTALTDTDLRGASATRNDNRYLCKLRRID